VEVHPLKCEVYLRKKPPFQNPTQSNSSLDPIIPKKRKKNPLSVSGNSRFIARHHTEKNQAGLLVVEFESKTPRGDRRSIGKGDFSPFLIGSTRPNKKLAPKRVEEQKMDDPYSDVSEDSEDEYFGSTSLRVIEDFNPVDRGEIAVKKDTKVVLLKRKGNYLRVKNQDQVEGWIPIGVVEIMD